MKYVWCALIGYLVCGINPAYLLSRIRGFDIRLRGSGNAGASNALIVLGKLSGVFCALFDIFKAAVIVWLMRAIFPNAPLVFPITALFCVLGHIFPIGMKFRGGKGLACLGGVILAFDWRVFLLMLAAELVLVLIVDYICFVPITASVIFPLVYGLITHQTVGALILCMISVVIFIKHFENIRRINSSFANALIGNALALYGKEYIRIKGLREELKVVIVAALVYGENIKQQENTSDDSGGPIQKLLHLLKQNTKNEELAYLPQSRHAVMIALRRV